MFYNYLIFNMVTLSLRILLKYCVSLRETYGFHTENIKQTKPKRHYLQQAFQILSDKKSPEVQKHTSGDFSQDKLYSLNFSFKY